MADYPNLLHPVPITLRLADKDSTLMDEDAGEPIGKVARSVDKIIDGQVSWKMQEFTMREGGKVVTADGYILFRRKDLDEAGINVQEEDLIVNIGEGDGDVNVNFYVVRIQLRGHYPEFGGHTLVKAWYAKKTPVRYK